MKNNWQELKARIKTFVEFHAGQGEASTEKLYQSVLDMMRRIETGGNNTNESRWNEVEHQLDLFKSDVFDSKQCPELSRYWGCMSRCQAVLWALLNYIRYYESI